MGAVHGVTLQEIDGKIVVDPYVLFVARGDTVAFAAKGEFTVQFHGPSPLAEAKIGSHYSKGSEVAKVAPGCYRYAVALQPSGKGGEIFLLADCPSIIVK
jgi:hypothetical protein